MKMETLTDNALKHFCRPAEQPHGDFQYMTKSRYMRYEINSGLIVDDRDGYTIGTNTTVSRTADGRYVDIIMPITDMQTPDSLRAMIAALDENSNDDKETKKESADGTDAN